jgi:hypothetical protein
MDHRRRDREPVHLTVEDLELFRRSERKVDTGYAA